MISVKKKLIYFSLITASNNSKSESNPTSSNPASRNSTETEAANIIYQTSSPTLPSNNDINRTSSTIHIHASCDPGLNDIQT